MAKMISSEDSSRFYTIFASICASLSEIRAGVRVMGSINELNFSNSFMRLLPYYVAYKGPEINYSESKGCANDHSTLAQVLIKKSYTLKKSYILNHIFFLKKKLKILTE